jgi:hypothetical protein
VAYTSAKHPTINSIGAMPPSTFLKNLFHSYEDIMEIVTDPELSWDNITIVPTSYFRMPSKQPLWLINT